MTEETKLMDAIQMDKEGAVDMTWLKKMGKHIEDKYGGSPSSQERYLIAKKRYGSFDVIPGSEEQKIKEQISKKKSPYQSYFITRDQKVADRVAKVNRYQQREQQMATYRELKKQPTNRFIENLKHSVDEKDFNKFTEGVATTIGATRINEEGRPRMAIPAYGSMSPPSDIRQMQQIAQRTKKKVYIQNQNWQKLRQQGYSDEQISSMGFANKRSEYYQSESIFGPGVTPYRPISLKQSFLERTESSQDRTRPTWIDRIRSGQRWQGFNPMVIGRDTPMSIRPRIFSPMSHEIDPLTGQVKKKFFSPPVVRW